MDMCIARCEQAGIRIRIKGWGWNQNWSGFQGCFAGIRIGIQMWSFPGIGTGIRIKMYAESNITASNCEMDRTP